jgi:hypothetical protein
MITRPIALGIALALACSPANAQQQNPPSAALAQGHLPAARTRFETTVSLRGQDGKAQTFRLSLGSVALTGKSRLEVPAMGFYIATLVSTDVLNIVGDQKITRHTGESWPVQAGESMTFEPQGRSHSVLLDVFRIEPTETPQ